MRILNSATELVGNTPLVRLNRIMPKGSSVLAKLEYFNPAHSVKDRVGLAIITTAERSGILQPGGTIVEATSGNTGIALAWIGASRGYRVILTMPASMSYERRALLRGFGAQLVLTDPSTGMKGAVDRAQEIVASTPGAILASQFTNPANPSIHETTTGPEIWRDTDGQVDVLIAGIGTGGTITGTGRYLRQKNPDLHIVGVEPEASALLSTGKAGPHPIQGIGANFIPDVLDTEIFDEIVAIGGDDAIDFARQAAHREGLLVGISSGAALAASYRVASRPEYAGANIVTIIPDFGERYVSTALFSTDDDSEYSSQ
ncbi:cysteine synthase A [Trueperella sp. LYQ141]|uniref:cysteine synthase A n=1 Tax=Trueperella sp. LYQ141 TaxID=3391058 RepID=UPI003983C374